MHAAALPAPPQSPPEGIRAGIDLFNCGEFHKAHELMERTWRATPGPERVLYQALIQAAVAFWRLGQGKPAIALMLLHRALPKLEEFRPTCAGIDVESLYRAIVVLRDRISAPGARVEHRLPKIHTR